jgi:Ca2+-binding RTX toxin-like protein
MENIAFNRASIQQQAAKGILPENTNTNFQSTMKAVSDSPMSQTAILASLEQMIKDLVAGFSEDKEKSSSQSTDDKVKEATGGAGEAATNGGDIGIQAENGTDGAIGQQASFWQVGTNSDDDMKGRSQLTDYMWAGNGDDKMDGKSGNDYLFGGNGDDEIRGGSGDDWLIGGAGDDDLNGGSGRDNIVAYQGQNTVNAGSDDDTIYSGLGHFSTDGAAVKNEIDGGSGDDKVRYIRGSNEYVITPDPKLQTPPADGVYTVTHIDPSTGEKTIDRVKNVEHLTFGDGVTIDLP